MEVITTHIDAEFDSFASMVAAKKLYPDARLVFPGSQERSLREFLRGSLRRFGVQRLKSIDLERVTRLIVVDTRRKDRIGAFAGIVDRKDLEVHIFDHHPPSPRDFSGTFETVEMVGANITLMVEILMRKKLALSPEEATLFALGLYEDTGSLLFASTTSRDLKAAAYLLEEGANLNVVADRMRQEMSPEQVLILNDLIKSLDVFAVKDIEVAVATVRRDHYVGDLSVIAHRLKDMKNLNVLFVLARMGDRIHLVARSRIEAVDVGEVAYRFGGGGHPAAASATIRSRRLAEKVRELKKVLRSTIIPQLRARDIMTAPVRSLSFSDSLAAARKFQGRTGLHIFPVVEGKTFRGLITRPVVEKAVRHGFGDALLSDYMETEIETVTPSASFSRVEDIMVEKGQRFLPVLEGKAVVGAITRTDYFRALKYEAARRPPFGYEQRLPKRLRRDKDLSSLIEERLSLKARRLLELIGKEGDVMGVPVYIVGGGVRDLLLHEENLDFDVMVEGDGIEFARRLGAKLKGRVNSYKRFETAVVILPDGGKIDVATSRAEYYDSPGAFPRVEHGTVKMDLFRRDFTINALALQLNMEKFGLLRDFFGGQEDLEGRKIRVLHNLSFVEDPTRVFRAIRFETRLGFRLGEVTHRLIKDAVGKDLLGTMAGRRLYGELTHILKEKDPLPALQRMEELGILKFIHPSVRVTRKVLRLFRALRSRLDDLKEGGEHACFYLAALSESLGKREREEMLERLDLTEKVRQKLRALTGSGRVIRKALDAKAPFTPGDVHEILFGLSRGEVIYAWAAAERKNRAAAIENYLKVNIGITTALKGRDLKKLGFPPGPAYRKILSSLLKEKINGRLATRKEEETWVLRTFASNGERKEATDTAGGGGV